MAAVTFLTFALIICTTHSQKYGPGIFPLPMPRVIEAAPSPPSTSEIFAPSGPVSILSSLSTPCGPITNTLPNFMSLSPTIASTPPCNQPTFNIPPVIQNLPSTIIAQPILNLPVPKAASNPVPTIVNVPACSPAPLPPITNTPASLLTSLTTPSIVAPVPACTATPAVTTVVDNTLANSLANAIQLLIVSNLIENTLGSNNNNRGCANLAPNVPCFNNYEVVTPDFTSVPVVSCDYPINVVPYPDPVCSFPEQIYSFADPVCTFPEPMVFIPEPVCQMPCIDYSTNYAPIISVIDPSSCINNCGQNQLFFDTPNQFGPQISPNLSCELPVVASISPMALEVPFPSEIPAQLTCNFGYMNSNVPCVSFNVEPLPCNNMQIFGNYGSFI